MRTFVLHGAAFLALQTGLLATYEALTPVDTGVFEAAAIDKEERLRTTPSPRLVLVGGSNVAFGYDCGRLDGAFTDYTPVNMGVNAGFGLDAILAEALEGLREGDLVVVSPEYGHFVELRAEVAMFEWLYVHPAATRFLSMRYVKPIGDQAFVFLGRQLQRSLLAMRGDAVERSMPYRRQALDGYGDVIGHMDLEPAHGIDAPIALPLSSRTIGWGVSAIEDFDRAARSRGAQVVVEFAPIPENTHADWAIEVAQVHAALQATDLELLNEPVAWPVERFFDTRYHLRRTAAQERTATLIPLLRPWIDR